MKTALRIIGTPYAKVATNLRTTIREIREDGTLGKVLNSLSLIPLGGSIIMMVIALIVFIAKNGFGRQIELLKTNWWDAVTSSDSGIWTVGTSGYFYNMWICIALGALLLALGTFAAINLFKEGSKVKKIVFAISGILFVPALVSTIIGSVKDNLVLAFVGLGVSIVTGIVCLVILGKTDYFKSCIVNNICFFAVAPATLLIIENIIGIVAFVITLAVIGIVGLIFGSSLGSGSGTASVSSGTDTRAAKENRKKQNEIARLKNEIEKSERNIKGYYNKELTCGTVDPKYWSNHADKARKEIERLNAQ